MDVRAAWIAKWKSELSLSNNIDKLAEIQRRYMNAREQRSEVHSEVDASYLADRQVIGMTVSNLLSSVVLTFHVFRIAKHISALDHLFDEEILTQRFTTEDYSLREILGNAPNTWTADSDLRRGWRNHGGADNQHTSSITKARNLHR